MNRDVLDCKRRAIRMETSENLPRNGNSRKRGSLGTLLFGAVGDVHESNYNEIASDLIKEAALRTRGAGGPWNVDTMAFKGSLLTSRSRILALICATLLLIRPNRISKYFQIKATS